MEKVLWFEGAGCVKVNDVPNCRIRTAFVNDEGRWVYLEILSATISKEHAKSLAGEAGWKVGDEYAYVDAAFYITDDPSIDDCNENRLAADVHNRWHRWYWAGRKAGEFTGNIWETVRPYTMNGILRIVNEDCHASFDRIEVTTDILAGYYVFNESGEYDTYSRYNRGDLFRYDEAVHKEMQAKRAELKEYHERIFGMRYDNTSYWNASDGTHTSNLMKVCVNVGKEKREAVYPQREFVIEVV